MDLSISFLGSDELTIADEIQTVEDNTYELGIHEQIETSYLQSVPNEFQEKFTSLSSYPQCDHQSNASDSNMSDHANLSNSVDQVNSQLSQKTQFTDPNEEEEEGECTQNSFFPTQSSERTNGSPASQFGEPLQTQQRASPLINHNYMSDHSHQQLQREQSQPTQKKIEILVSCIIHRVCVYCIVYNYCLFYN